MSCSSTLSQPVVLPAGSSGRLAFWTYLTTQETGSTAYDKLVAKIDGTTVATVSNASTKGSWFSTSVDLSAYAGKTVTLQFAESDDSTLPTSFWLDDVSVSA